MRLRLLSSLGAVVLFAMLAFGGPAAALAQGASTPEASPEASPAFSPADLPGFQQGYARAYSSDLSALSATPVAAEATPDYASFGVVTLSVVILAFDSEDNAAGSFEPVVQQVTSPASTGGIELKELTVEGLAGPTVAYSAAIDQGPGLTLHEVVLLTQDGPYIYQTIAIALSSPEDAQAFAVNVTQAIVAAPAGEGTGTLAPDGTSTGGPWDKLPKAGDPVLEGMTPVSDDVFDPDA